MSHTPQIELSSANAPGRRRRPVRTIGVIAAVLAALLLLASVIVGVAISSISMQLVTPPGTSVESWEPPEGLEMPVTEFVDTYDGEDVMLASTVGDHDIPATVLYTQESDAHGWVVLVHGLGANRTTTYPWAEYFLERGFNTISYDQRSSGENLAEHTTFGVWERHDLVDCLTWLEETGRAAPDDTIGVWGTSFGGATSGLAMALGDTGATVDFLVLDSPVSDMDEMIRRDLDKRGFPPPLGYWAWWGELVTQLRLGISARDADVPLQLSEIEEMPQTLVIAGTGDDLTPPHMGADIADAIGEERAELWQPEGVGHVRAWFTHRDEYVARLDALLTRVGVRGAEDGRQAAA